MSGVAGDQTRGDSTPFIGGPDAVPMSRGEVSALCMKAARGAGMSWGLAEEAGFAAAWLAERGIDGPEHLLAHLSEAQGRPWAELCPTVAPGEWAAPPGATLCPIALGATLCDHAALPEGPGAARLMRIGPVDHPVLLLPFLAAIAKIAGIAFDVAWEGGTATIDAHGAGLDRAAREIGGRTGLPLRLTGRAGDASVATSAPTPAPAVAAGTIAALSAFAMRTTVPASDASRAGAGAGASDND